MHYSIVLGALATTASAGVLAEREVSAISKVNAAFRDPLAACFWWSIKSQGYSPMTQVSGFDLIHSCPTILLNPSAGKTTMKAVKTNGTPLETVQNGVANSKQFCQFWKQSIDNIATPFTGLSVAQVDAACKTILGKTTVPVNYIANPYFEGSGTYDYGNFGGYEQGLVLPKWQFGGAHVENDSPPGDGSVAGNSILLATYGNGPRYSYIEQGLLFTPFTFGNYTISFDSSVFGYEYGANPDASISILWNHQAVWSQSINSTKQFVSTTTHHSYPVELTQNSGAEFAFNASAKTDNWISWRISNVTLFKRE